MLAIEISSQRCLSAVKSNSCRWLKWPWPCTAKRSSHALLRWCVTQREQVSSLPSDPELRSADVKMTWLRITAPAFPAQIYSGETILRASAS